MGRLSYWCGTLQSLLKESGCIGKKLCCHLPDKESPFIVQCSLNCGLDYSANFSFLELKTRGCLQECLAASTPLLFFYDLPVTAPVGAHSSAAEASTSWLWLLPPGFSERQRIHNGQGLECTQARLQRKQAPGLQVLSFLVRVCVCLSTQPLFII